MARADNSGVIIKAARDRRESALQRARAALQHFECCGGEINFRSLADAAGVSRSWLYREPTLRSEINGSATPAAVLKPRKRPQPSVLRTSPCSVAWRLSWETSLASGRRTADCANKSPACTANGALGGAVVSRERHVYEAKRLALQALPPLGCRE
jgi:hypothetical protein